MPAARRPKLDLAKLVATHVFTEDDLVQNRRGALSPAQNAWRAANPRLVIKDESESTLAVLVGRVMVEGRYLAGQMGQTTFAQLVTPGRRISLRAGLERSLVRDAPYRAYVADGWVWSIEPIGEDELRAATSGLATYRSPPGGDGAGDAGIARALLEALSAELSFDEEDVEANVSGRFSAAQRSLGRKKVLSASAGLLVSIAAVCGFAAVLLSGVAFPAFAAFLGIAALVAGGVNSARSLADAWAQAAHLGPLSAIARLDNDPTNRDKVVLRTEERPLKIKRAAVAIAEAPFSALRAWRFEVFFLPKTWSIVSVRPIAPPPAVDATPDDRGLGYGSHATGLQNPGVR